MPLFIPRWNAGPRCWDVVEIATGRVVASRSTLADAEAFCIEESERREQAG